jgi:RND family efflux transporter MFP subunit
MSRTKLFLPLLILTGAVIIAALLIYSRPQAEQVALEKRPLLVDVVEVVKQDLQVTVHAQGMVIPRTQTTLISEVAGQVISVAPQFLVGGFFKKGDVLLRIDDRNYRSQLKRAEAEVASAQSDLAQEKGRGHVARQDWLKRGSAGKVSEEAKALSLRQPQLLDSQAGLASARANLKSAQDDLERTVIKAPYDGLVREKLVDVGQFVSASTPLGTTFAVDRAEVRLALSESKLPYLHLPDAFVADEEQSQNFPAVILKSRIDEVVKQWPAALVRTEGVLDARSRVLFAVAQVEDPYGIHADKTGSSFTPLRIGSFVEAEIEGKLLKDLIKLPRHVLRAGNKLWVVNDDDRLEERLVKPLRTDGREMYIRSGLETGDRVCLTSVGAVLPGTPVRIASSISQRSAIEISSVTAAAAAQSVQVSAQRPE